MPKKKEEKDTKPSAERTKKALWTLAGILAVVLVIALVAVNSGSTEKSDVPQKKVPEPSPQTAPFPAWVSSASTNLTAVPNIISATASVGQWGVIPIILIVTIGFIVFRLL